MKHTYLTASVFSIVALSFPLVSFAHPGHDYRKLGLETGVGVNIRAGAASTSLDMRARLELQKTEMEARRAEYERELQERKVELEVRKETSVAKRMEFRREIAERQATNTSRVLEATLVRLERIISRIESRIAKEKAEGKVTLEAEGFLALAKSDLVEAKADIAVLANLDLSGSDAEEVFAEVRTAAKEAKDHIRAAHTNLTLTVRVLGEVKSENSNEEEGENN